MNRVIEVNIEKNEKKQEAKDIYEGRKVITDISLEAKEVKSDVTLIVQTFNQLEKTKRCVESIMKYTTDVDYDIILIDNGSEPEVMEYFESVPIEKKTIIHVKNNVGTAFPNEVISMNMLSRYVGYMTCDLIVTKNWLSNLLKVMESDERIGIVNPVSNNTSNGQNVNLQYDTYDEMQEKAALHNVSDATKWHERLRILTLGTIFRKECIYAMGWPITDVGFWHDFLDDDMAFRARRVGYKVVLAGDTWICHDHPQSERDFEKLEKSINAGRKNFNQKYFGIDAWDDVMNHVQWDIANFIKDIKKDKATILGMDVKCGSPMLDIKNIVRRYGIYESELSAYTQECKYVPDLNTICEGYVVCDREEYITRKLPYDYYDYIIVGKDINAYHEPMNVLMDLYMLLKQGGQMMFSLKNTNSIYSLMQMLGYEEKDKNEFYYNYSMKKIFDDLKHMGINVSVLVTKVAEDITKEEKDIATIFTKKYCKNETANEMYYRLIADRVWYSIEK